MCVRDGGSKKYAEACFEELHRLKGEDPAGSEALMGFEGLINHGHARQLAPTPISFLDQ
jgi:hypothetical protein